MTGNRFGGCVALGLGLLWLAACSSGTVVGERAIPKPPAPGLYALDNRDRLLRLDGPPEWEVRSWGERSDLDPGTLLVIDDPRLAPLRARLQAPALELRQVAWLRSEINSVGAVSPVRENNWVDTDLASLRVPLQVYWVGAAENTIVARPLRPLEPGIYAVHFAQASPPLKARLGVEWSKVDERAYAGNKCVDRYLGAAPEYGACVEQSIDIAMLPLRQLRVGRMSAQQQMVDNEPRLVVRGEVTNTGAEPVHMPQLVARTLAEDGRVLGQWLFPADKSILQAGESTTFRTDIRRPSAAIADVNVDLALPDDRWRRAEARR